MSNLKLVLAVMAFGLMACGVEAGASSPPLETTSSSELAVAPHEASGETTGKSSVQGSPCYVEVLCRVCGVVSTGGRRFQNYYVEECEDGSETEVGSGPCGSECL